MQTIYYRYVSDVSERNQIIAARKVLSMNATSGHKTWYTPTRYDDPAAAQRDLALPSQHTPIYRVGPIPEDVMPPLTVGLGRVQPAFGHPGGGLEIATQTPVWLFGIWSFANQTYDSSI